MNVITVHMQNSLILTTSRPKYVFVIIKVSSYRTYFGPKYVTCLHFPALFRAIRVTPRNMVVTTFS